MNIRSYHFYNNHFLNKFFSEDMHLFELGAWIQSTALALISVFVPIILYSKGFSIKEVFGFYLLFSLIDTPLNLLAKKFIYKYGARQAMILAVSSQVIFLLLLNLLQKSWTQAILVIIFLSIYDAFYWVSSLYIFLQSEHKEKVGVDVGAFNIARALGGLVAPAIGALIFMLFGSKILLGLATASMFVSLIPLFRMRHMTFVPEHKADGFKHFFSKPIEKANYFFDALAAVQQDLEDVIWPFFIFFLYQSVNKVAYAPMLIAAADIILIYLTTKFSLRLNVYKIVSRGSLTILVVWLFRLFAPASSFLIFGSIFAVAMLSIFIEIPLEISMFERGRKIDTLNTVTYKNFFRMFSRVIFYAILFLSANPFKSAFWIVLIVLFLLYSVSYIVSKFSKDMEKVIPEPTMEEEALS